MAGFFHTQLHRGRPLVAGDRRVVPVARSVEIALRPPLVPVGGRFVWVLPTAVEVEEAVSSRRIPIPYYTLWVEMGLIAATLAIGLASLLRRSR